MKKHFGYRGESNTHVAALMKLVRAAAREVLEKDGHLHLILSGDPSPAYGDRYLQFALCSIAYPDPQLPWNIHYFGVGHASPFIGDIDRQAKAAGVPNNGHHYVPVHKIVLATLEQMSAEGEIRIEPQRSNLASPDVRTYVPAASKPASLDFTS